MTPRWDRCDGGVTVGRSRHTGVRCRRLEARARGPGSRPGAPRIGKPAITHPPTRAPSREAGTRIAGVDLARALAILGMFAVHIGPTGLQDVPGRLYALPHGRASILFGLVAGVGVSLLVASRTTSTAQARVRLLWRSVILLPLGLALQPLDHGVFVILQDYAVLFLVAVPLVGLADRWLLALAAGTGLVGSVGYLWGLIAWPDAFERHAAQLGDPLGEMAHRLVLSGPYPLITWLAPFLVGMWLGRRDLRAAATRTRLLLGGLGVVVLAHGLSWVLVVVLGEPVDPVGWDRLIIDDPHSQMPLWLLGATGTAMLVLGAALWLGEVGGRLAWPLVSVGQLAFTVYVGHVLALHVWRGALTSQEVGPAALLVASFAAASMTVSIVCRAGFDRGPLELLLHLPWLLAGRRRSAHRRSGG